MFCCIGIIINNLGRIPTIDALKEAGIRDRVRVIVDGAALNDAYAQEIDADGFALDASRAVNLARSLLG